MFFSAGSLLFFLTRFLSDLNRSRSTDRPALELGSHLACFLQVTRRLRGAKVTEGQNQKPTAAQNLFPGNMVHLL